MPKMLQKGSTAKNPTPNLTPPPAGVPTGLNSPASPAGGGNTVEDMIRKSNFWRDNYNPLRSLTIARLMAIFEQAERGAFAELQLTLRKAEKRFPVLKGFIEKLLSSIEELEWNVKIMDPLPEGATPEMAKAQCCFLKRKYQLLQRFQATLGQIALADVRGYCVLQKRRYRDGGPNDGAVSELYWLEPWCFSRDGYYGDFFYNENSLFGVGLGTCVSSLGEENRIGGAELPRGEFVIREVNSPLYEIALIAMVNWLMARKDYSAFVEIFGLPNSVVIMPPGIPAGKEAEYQAAAEKVAQGISGALPNGSDVKFPGQGTRGEDPFTKYCDAQEKDVVLAGTGGHLTMLSQPTGIGKGASEEHDGAWQTIATNKARRVNETLQRDFDAPELAAEFPDQPVCVYFELAVKDTEDVSQLMDTVVKAESVGLQTDATEISERSGLKLTRAEKPGGENGGLKREDGEDPEDPALDPEPEKTPEDKITNRATEPATSNPQLATTLATAVAEDLRPYLAAVAEQAARIAEISDPALRKQKTEELFSELQSLQADILVAPKSAGVLAKAISQGLMDGMKNQPTQA